MKTATIPSLRVDVPLREAAIEVLEDGETLSSFVNSFSITMMMMMTGRWRMPH
jgi:hypothetical protein